LSVYAAGNRYPSSRETSNKASTFTWEFWHLV
jgi:hypothetical protein